MGMYAHFTLEERFILARLYKKPGYTLENIADILGRSPGTLSREMSRNKREDGTYHPRTAHKLARERRTNAKKGSRRIENDQELEDKLRCRLDPLTSPEVVATDEDISVCTSTIYNWILRSCPDVASKLPYRGKKRRKYGTKRGKKQGWTRHVRPISSRPNGSSLSWEGDTVLGSSKARLLTHVERASRFLRVDLLPDGTATEVQQTLARRPLIGDEVTYDRGSEFALWRLIEKGSNLTVYFADAHHPWQRGTNENTNGRLRRIYPKGTDFRTLPKKDIAAVVWKMNHTKRKCLHWRTPCEVYGYCCSSE